MKIKRKASDSFETDAQIKEVYTEKVEEICNESLHSNIEYFQDIGPHEVRYYMVVEPGSWLVRILSLAADWSEFCASPIRRQAQQSLPN